jgi:hypothetical protein
MFVQDGFPLLIFDNTEDIGWSLQHLMRGSLELVSKADSIYSVRSIPTGIALGLHLPSPSPQMGRAYPPVTDPHKQVSSMLSSRYTPFKGCELMEIGGLVLSFN